MVQKNRFEVLVQNELESYKVADEELEDELNAELQKELAESDDVRSSIQSTEFVANTHDGPILERVDDEGQSCSHNDMLLEMERNRLMEIERKKEQRILGSILEQYGRR